jgi:hypothetical protein
MSRWGGFRKGRKRVKDKNILLEPVKLPAYIDKFSYTDAEGIWNLNSTTQFEKKIRFVELLSTSFEGGTNSTFTATIPSDAKSGDLAVLFAAGDSSSTSLTTPSGWTLLGAVSSGDPRLYSYYKLIEPGDIGSTISISSTVSTSFSCGVAVFSTQKQFVNIDSYGYSNTSSASAFSSSISSSTGAGFVIAIACLVGRPPSQQPTLTMSPYSDIIDNGNMTIGYTIFNNSQTLDISISTNDAGRQSLTGFYLVVS